MKRGASRPRLTPDTAGAIVSRWLCGMREEVDRPVREAGVGEGSEGLFGGESIHDSIHAGDVFDEWLCTRRAGEILGDDLGQRGTRQLLPLVSKSTALISQIVDRSACR